MRYKCEFQELYEYRIDFKNWHVEVGTVFVKVDGSFRCERLLSHIV